MNIMGIVKEQMAGMVVILILMALVVPNVLGETTYNEDERNLRISPANPVRFKGDSVDIKLATFEGFSDDYFDPYCMVTFDGEKVKIPIFHTALSAVVFTYNLSNVQNSGFLNATVDTDDAASVSVGQTFITVLNKPRHTVTVMMENSDGELYCLDHDDLGSNLITIWYKNGQMIQELTSTKPLEITAEKGIERNNYTCIIATQHSKQHYGGMDNATKAGATVSVTKNVCVLHFSSVDAKNGTNFTANIDCLSELRINFTDSNGQLLASGFPSVHAITNQSYVTVIVEDSYDVIFKKNHTLQDDAKTIDKPESKDWIAGVVIAILAVGAIIAIVIYCLRRKKMLCWKDGKGPRTSMKSKSVDSHEPVHKDVSGKEGSEERSFQSLKDDESFKEGDTINGVDPGNTSAHPLINGTGERVHEP